MGNSRWDVKDWATYSAGTSKKADKDIFTSRSMSPELDPHKFTIRESVDSDANPKSTPIIIGSDVTGSMGHLASEIIKRGLGVIMKEIYDRKPVSDPQICAMALGDAYCDSASLQMTQFEAGVAPLTAQIEKMFIEQGGGGNDGESYNLAWYAAAYRTKCDAITKRKRKGYLFTIGDEPPLPGLGKPQILHATGDNVEADMTSSGLLNMITPHWEVFHLIVGRPVRRAEEMWKRLLGERAIMVSDHTKLAEVIVSTIQVIEGAHVDDVVGSWSGDTSVVVGNAVRSLRARPGHVGPESGPVSL